jgi:hypothetical protein
MELTVCPRCGGTAEVEWRRPLDSTDGSVEHVKLLCIGRHWFLMPASGMPALDLPTATTSPSDRSGR